MKTLKFFYRLTDCFFWAFFVGSAFSLGCLMLTDHPIRSFAALYVTMILSIINCQISIYLKKVIK